MTVKKRFYGIVSAILLLMAIIILSVIDKTNNIRLSLAVQILLILYLSKTMWGCIIYIRDKYKEQKYSYSIIMNLGLVIFLTINIVRQINLLFVNWNLTSINDLYLNTLNSFSYFVLFMLPLIAIIAIYSIFTNIILIIKERCKLQNLLGIIFGILIILGALASQYIFEIVEHSELFNSKIYIVRFIEIVLNSVLCYFYCLTLATLYANIMAVRHKPNLDKDFVIVLGCKVKNDGSLTPILKARVDNAMGFAREQKEKVDKNIIFVLSGGQGQDEVISEAEAMKKYLIEKGISEKDIVIENKSTNTLQNMRFSKNKIDEINRNGKIIFSTTNYHVFRSGVIANKEGIDCEGIGSKAKWYFYANALIREFVANLLSERKKHLALIISINIAMLVLVLIGYKYSLI